MANTEIRCGRCGATLEQRRGATRGMGAAAIVTGASAVQLPLCATHAEEVRLLLEHYAAHRISVLPGNRLCLTLTDADITRRKAPEQRDGRRGAALLVAEPAWFAGLPPELWVAKTPLEHTWTCANVDCRVEQARDAVRTYARVRGHNALYAIGPECAGRLGPDPEIEIE